MPTYRFGFVFSRVLLDGNIGVLDVDAHHEMLHIGRWRI